MITKFIHLTAEQTQAVLNKPRPTTWHYKEYVKSQTYHFTEYMATVLNMWTV